MDPVVFLINENIISVLRFWANVLRLMFLINLYDFSGRYHVRCQLLLGFPDLNPNSDDIM